MKREPYFGDAGPWRPRNWAAKDWSLRWIKRTRSEAIAYVGPKNGNASSERVAVFKDTPLGWQLVRFVQAERHLWEMKKQKFVSHVYPSR